MAGRVGYWERRLPPPGSAPLEVPRPSSSGLTRGSREAGTTMALAGTLHPHGTYAQTEDDPRVKPEDDGGALWRVYKRDP